MGTLKLRGSPDRSQGEVEESGFRVNGCTVGDLLVESTLGQSWFLFSGVKEGLEEGWRMDGRTE